MHLRTADNLLLRTDTATRVCTFRNMEVQNPFQILWEKIPSSNFTDFLLAKFPKYGSNLAMVNFLLF